LNFQRAYSRFYPVTQNQLDGYTGQQKENDGAGFNDYYTMGEYHFVPFIANIKKGRFL
jgi:hypothetical protein